MSYISSDDLAVEVLFFLGGGDEKEMERRNGTDPSGFWLIQALLSTFSSFSALSLNTNRIHNYLHCHDHLTFALICGLPSVEHTVSVHLNEFTSLSTLHENAHFLKNLLDWYFVFNLPI